MPFKLIGQDEDDVITKGRQISNGSYTQHTDPGAEVDDIILNDASFVSCYTNLTNTIIGSGVLGLPYAIANSGLILGVMLVLISSGLTIFSLHLLAICATKVPPPASFYSVTEASVPHLTFMIDLAVAIQCFGVCSSYLIVIGGLMPDVMTQIGEDGFFTERFPWILLGFAVVAPLSCFKKMDALKFTSGLSVAFVFFLMTLVFLYSLKIESLPPCTDDGDDDGECKGDIPMFSITGNTFRVLSIFIFAFSCQTNIFNVVNELRNPTQARFDAVSGCAIVTSGSIYLVVAVAGFLTYGTEVESNILISYPKTKLTSAARVFVSMLVAFSYPILFLPGRSSIMGLWRGFDKDPDAWHKYNSHRYVIVTVCLLAASLGTALLVEDLGLVFGLVGATGATMISFILPGISYYKMHDTMQEGAQWKRTGALLLCGLGCVIMPVCTVFLFL